MTTIALPTVDYTQTIACPHCGRAILTTGKDIHYCVEYIQVGRRRERVCHEYVAYYDGRELGAGYSTHHDAEIALDAHALDLIDEGLTLTATELDGGSNQDEIAAEYAEALPSQAQERACDGWANACTAAVTQTLVVAWPLNDGRMHGPEVLHLCDEHAARWQQFQVKPGATDDPSHNLITPDPAECPDISAPRPCEDLPTAQAEPEEDDEDDDYEEGDPRDEDVYAPPFGLPAPSGYRACERYSTPPSLALWGPDTPVCPKCGTHHDPVVGCPVRCANCDKSHHIQRCPEVWRALLG